MRTATPRRIVALIAAYVIALQALLLPLSVANAAPIAGVTCVTAQAGDPPSNHGTGCPCAAGCGMHCCASAFAAPPAAGLVRIAFSFRAAAPAPRIVAPGRTAGHNPQIPRAPPIA